MAKPTTKQELIEYCLRKLGKPVINIEASIEQLDDRIDEALQIYQERHYDATEEQWVYYQLTEEDITNKYVLVPTDYLSVIEVMPMASINNSGDGMFSFKYQVMLSELRPWKPFDSIDYFLKMTSLDEVRQLIDTDPRFKFIRHENKLKIYKNYKEGQGLLLRLFKIIDPQYVYNDKWLKQYCTALIKRQWGENTKKFENVQLLGGVTISGQQIFNEAIEEIQKLEQDLEDTYTEPTSFIFG